MTWAVDQIQRAVLEIVKGGELADLYDIGCSGLEVDLVDVATSG